MSRRLLTALGTLLLAAAPLAAAEPAIPPAEAVLAGLRTEHPRLLATAADFERLKDRCAENVEARQWFTRLKADAERLLSTPVLEYKIPDGKRLLAVSRAAKDRVLLLGLIYRLTGDERFANRLWQELDTVINFKDWNPSHFLDTAEMTFAVAIATTGSTTPGRRRSAAFCAQRSCDWASNKVCRSITSSRGGRGPFTIGTRSVTAAWRSERSLLPTRSRHSPAKFSTRR
jgi:hypothetical protein